MSPDDWALLAVQGPRALERLGIELAPFTFREDEVLGVQLPRRGHRVHGRARL